MRGILPRSLTWFLLAPLLASPSLADPVQLEYRPAEGAGPRYAVTVSALLDYPLGRNVPVSADVPDREGAVLVFDEDLPSGCRLHGAHRQNCYPAVPFDVSTRLPMLSFYGFPVD